ncbi:MAG: hypothetical protein KatS3mg003_0971 [Candidatus Nitrosocaldaceae archaeon]|nr:MAG: hypothetical protein KatS3mg003_0971 [Candidatus Nitrosocaldaceae archaeon]
MDITDAEKLDEIIKDKAVVLFYADWCPYCAAFKPIFDSYNIDGFKLVKVKINEDDNPLWDRFDIMRIPTVIVFKDGKVISRRDAKSGIGLSKSDMDSLVKELN